MAKLKVLFLCPQPLWPTNTGARLRNFHLAKALSATCEVTILQAVDPVHSSPVTQTSSSFKAVLSGSKGKSYTPLKLFRGIIGPLPVTVLNYQSSDIQRVLMETLASVRYDILQVESIHMAPYLLKLRNRPAVMLDWHNIESELMQRFGKSATSAPRKLVAARTGKLLRRLEDRVLKSFPAHAVVSEVERNKLLDRSPGAKICVIPNGVDTVAFTCLGPPVGQGLVFVGSMDYHANYEAVLWFCRDIWPNIAAQFPDITFKVVGRNPPASIQALASSRIFITGTVDDVRPYYHEAVAVIVPILVGGGTRLKILEAMAAGVPVISTRLGAEGIAIEDRQNIFLADTADDIAKAIGEIKTNPALVTQIRENARTLVVNQYDWSVLGRQLASLYESLVT